MTTPEPTPDAILEEMEKDQKAPDKEQARRIPFRRCEWFGHTWGMAVEDRRRRLPIDRLVCIRGRGSMKGRCPAWKAVNPPDIGPTPEAPIAEFFLPTAEILRLRRHDWGEPLFEEADDA